MQVIRSNNVQRSAHIRGSVQCRRSVQLGPIRCMACSILLYHAVFNM